MSVVAPVPYAPPFPKFEKYQKLRRVPVREENASETIPHPRYVVVPKCDVFSGITYFMGCRGAVIDSVERHRAAILHVHCAYPDAVGVGLIARQLSIPYVVTVHGSDINVVAQNSSVRTQIRWALKNASGLIGVSDELCRKLQSLVPSQREVISQVPCAGVDPEVFSIRETTELKESLAVSRFEKIVLFAGRLVPIKSVDTLIKAWGQICNSHKGSFSGRLIIVGDGPERGALEVLATEIGVREKVRFMGEMSQDQLARWLSASAVFCLPSKSEGTPNTVVEALASGRPVVASRVGGIPNLICSDESGILVDPGNVDHLALGLKMALARQWNPELIARSVRHLTWDALADRNIEVLLRAFERFYENAR